MANDKLPTVKEPTTDLSTSDLAKIDSFVVDGLPGLAKVDEATMFKVMDLYLSGKSYREIASINRLEKRLVMYLSKKFDWFQMRQDYLIELENNMRDRVIASKLVSQDFLLQLTHLWQKKIGNKITKYLQTENEDWANAIDLKEVDRYIKTVDTLHKLQAEPRQPGEKGPAVGLNLGDGVSIKKIGENEVEITPKAKTVGNMLKKLAESRKQEELSKKSADIDESDTKEIKSEPKGEQDNEDQ